MTGQERPRHARAEIRAFADELTRGGWVYEGVDASGHTIWSHPKASGRFKLPETPRHFGVQRARRDVARLLGQKVAGKRNGGPKQKRARQDFVLVAARRNATPPPREPQASPPIPAEPVVPRRSTPRLPWEGADQHDHYDHGLDRLMREIPGRH